MPQTPKFVFRRTAGLCLFIALVANSLPKAHGQGTILRVAAAADLQTVMPEISKAFAAKTGAEVAVSYGASGNFVAQIENGAPFDLFFSADDEYPQKLINSGRAEPRTAVVYGIGSLVLWMPANARCKLAEEKWNCLLQPDVGKIAIANPTHAPYGRAAVSALQSAQIYEQVRGKLVLGESVAQAAQFVQSGNADAGLLAYSQTQAPSMRDGQQWVVPHESYPVIQQTVVMLKSAKQKSLAEEFIKFVTEGAGRELLRQHGFDPPAASTRPKERHK